MSQRWMMPFSILERIDVGETLSARPPMPSQHSLSVSSNGSTWVKPHGGRGGARWTGAFSILERIDVGETSGAARLLELQQDFQYPRTDRRG